MEATERSIQLLFLSISQVSLAKMGVGVYRKFQYSEQIYRLLIFQVSKALMIAGFILSIHKRLKFTNDADSQEDLYEDKDLFVVAPDTDGQVPCFWRYSVRPDNFQMSFFDSEMQEQIIEKRRIDDYSSFIEVRILTRASFEAIMVQEKHVRMGTETQAA